jgi:hypothetical protein
MNITNNKNVNINIYNFKDKELINDDNELFKRIDGYDNYSISNQGNVKNNKTNKIMKLDKNKKGYCRVTLSKRGKSKKHSIHRLVALAFLENTDNTVGKEIEAFINSINAKGVNTEVQIECGNEECEETYVSTINFDPVNFFTGS